MILLAALAASLFARRFTPKKSGSYGSLRRRRRDGQRLSRPLAGSLFIAEILFGT
jgi:CIC family chloride channel protein